MRVTDVIAAATAVALLLFAFTFVMFATVPSAHAAEVCGKASWYGNEHHGRRTASGEIFNQWGMTAAMPKRSMMGKKVRVTYRGKSVVLRVTDYGPAARLHRVMDLSRGAAKELGMIQAGVATVCYVVVR